MFANQICPLIRIFARCASKCWRGWSGSVIFQIASLPWLKSFQYDQLVIRPVEVGIPDFCVNGKFFQPSIFQFRVYKSSEHVFLPPGNRLDIRIGVHCAFCATFSNPISGWTLKDSQNSKKLMVPGIFRCNLCIKAKENFEFGERWRTWGLKILKSPLLGQGCRKYIVWPIKTFARWAESQCKKIGLSSIILTNPCKIFEQLRVTTLTNQTNLSKIQQEELLTDWRGKPMIRLESD